MPEVISAFAFIALFLLALGVIYGAWRATANRRAVVAGLQGRVLDLRASLVQIRRQAAAAQDVDPSAKAILSMAADALEHDDLHRVAGG